MVSITSFFKRELGIASVLASHSRRDVFLLFTSRFVRLFAFGCVTPILILHLRLLDVSDRMVGLFLSLTLVGDVILSLLVTWTADALGRRNVLAFGSALMLLSGVGFVFSGNYYLLLAFAVIGVVSPAGNEVGPFSAVEVGILSQLVDPAGRVFVLMWYQVLGFVGTSLGNLTSGLVVTTLTHHHAYPLIDAYRAVFIVYGIFAIIKVILSLSMTIYSEVDHPPLPPSRSAAVEPETASERQPLITSTASSAEAVTATTAATPAPLPLLRLTLLCLLFSLDSFASSLIPISFISYYLKLSYSASIEAITRTFSVGALIAGFSQLGAGSLARRIGIIPTMVGTHMPAQLLTISLAFAPTLSTALTLFIARSMIASMDTSVRGAFLSGIVPKAGRTRFLGIVNVCKTLASAPGPTLAGTLASFGSLRWTFVITGCLKLCYDIALWITFKTAKMEH